MAGSEDHDALAQTFASLTGADFDVATQYLTANNWDLDLATDAFYEDKDEDKNETATAAASSSSAIPADYTGPRTLDGRPVPQAIPTTSSAASKRPQKKKGLATLSSLGGGSSHDHDDDDDDDDDDAHRDTYAGGEKSGLAVQDPNQRADPRRIFSDLMSKARSNAQRPETSSPAGPSSSSAFHGGGMTLGGEGSESRYIPGPQGASGRARPQNGEVQERTLHRWLDGFSIDDGELHRFDDPANTEILQMIQQGRAPIHLLNVRYDDPIDVKLQEHNENYRPLPKKYKPFGSEGRRLGSPVPGEVAASVAATSAATSATTSATTSSTTIAAQSAAGPSTSADESQPTVTIRIQMLDGSRLPARFNTSQTVNDIYEFISRASPGLSSGGWVLATTFPNKDHTDKSLVIGEMPEFKKGGTAVVKRST